MTPRVRARALGTVAVVIVAGACRSADAVAPTTASVAGTYTLQTIGTHALPYQPAAQGPIIVGDSLVLGTDGSVQRTEVFRDPTFPAAGAYPARSTGTWAVHGDTVALAMAALGPTGSTLPSYLVVAGNAMTFVGPAEIGWFAGASGTGAVYRR